MPRKRPEPDLEIRPRGSTYELLPLNEKAMKFVNEHNLHGSMARFQPVAGFWRTIYIYSYEKGQSIMALAKATGLHATMHSSKLIF